MVVLGRHGASNTAANGRCRSNQQDGDEEPEDLGGDAADATPGLGLWLFGVLRRGAPEVLRVVVLDELLDQNLLIMPGDGPGDRPRQRLEITGGDGRGHGGRRVGLCRHE